MSYRNGDRIIGFTPSFIPFTVLYHLMLILAKFIDFLVFRLKVKGQDNLKRVEEAILISNHTLVMDPGLIAHAIRPRRTYFTMLEETASVPFLGTFVRLLGAVPIPEHSISIRTLEEAVLKALKELGYVHFFPEGECYLWNQEIQTFHPGAFYLACRLHIPVMPIITVLYERRWFGRNSLSLWGRTLRLPPKVTIIIGDPLYPEFFEDAYPNTVRIELDGVQSIQLSQAPHVASVKTATKTATSLRSVAKAMSRHVGELMQCTIDSEGGCKRIYRGKMARLVKESCHNT